jgi:transcriptional regulator with XRE-family HTH domain
MAAKAAAKRQAVRPKPDEIDVHVSKQLRARRMLLGLTQEGLAEHLGVTFPQVQKYENGTNRISASRLYTLAGLLDCSMDYFFEGLPASRSKRAVGAKSDAAVLKLMGSAEGQALCKAFAGIKSPVQRKAAIAFLRAANREGR